MDDMRDLIAQKRDGHKLSGAAIRSFIQGYTKGTIPDHQAAAWLMAVYWRGLDEEETTALTEAMADSGEQLDLSGSGGITADKHSTGGVGDKTTLVLVPLAAAAGLKMAKLSGRSLGHTGGTLDKLAAIPGFRVELGPAALLDQIARVGAAIAGQSVHLVPADQKLYHLRDATATVASIPLIAASVMSKKIAAGAACLVLDVKAGRGAFMTTAGEAGALARTMVNIGKRLGRRTSALVTRMDQPLGRAVGNSLEVAEAIAALRGKGPADLVELCLALGAEMLLLAGLAEDRDLAAARLAADLAEGRALAVFREMVRAQGGLVEVVDNPDLLPRAPRVAVLPSPADGFVTGLDALLVARAAQAAGARLAGDAVIDAGAGVVLERKVGDPVARGQTLAKVYLARHVDEDLPLGLLLAAFFFGPAPPAPQAQVIERVT